jgi:hypothetical protein
MPPTIITYDQLKEKFENNGGFKFNPTISDGGSTASDVTGTFNGTFTIEVPQLPDIRLPFNDLLFGRDFIGEPNKDLYSILGLKKGGATGVQNDFKSKGQVIINSDRLILNSRTDYLMLFGHEGVAISSKNTVHIDADDSVTIFGENGLFLGVPGKGNTAELAKLENPIEPKTKADATTNFKYEPLVLGNKLVNLLDDLIGMLSTALITAPMGPAYFREDTQTNFLCLQSRLPELLSTYAYIDGISHEGVLPPPEFPKAVTIPPTTLTGTVTGTFVGTSAGTTTDPNAASTVITNPLADQPGFYESIELYN